MENMINLTNRFVKSIIANDSLTGFLKNKCNGNGKLQSSPESYFFLTDLCSPMDSYIKRNFIIEESLESKKRMNTGNKIHRFAESWFQRIGGFESSESILDGVYFGLAVRGRIDARIGDSIIELKTKDIIPESKEEIIEKYPQDIEQLSFYACIDPTKPQTNYLVFISHENPAKVRAFKVEIKDFNKVKYVLKNRIDELGKAIKKNNPSNLGRCRYCWEGCKLKESGTCQWFNSDRTGCGVLEFIEISEDQEFGNKVKEAMESWDGYQDTLSVHNIIAPRRYLCQQVLGEQNDFEEDSDQVRNKDYIKKMAFELRRSFLPRDFETPKNNLKEISFSKDGWINLKSSQNPEGENIPFIAYSSLDNREEGLDKPGKYKIAELGIIVSNFNLPKGLIIVYYPKVGEKKYKVFEVEYSFNDFFKKKVKEVVDILKSEDITKLKQLPECPWFFHKDGNMGTCCS